MFNGYVLTIGLVLWGLQYGLAWDLGCLTPFQMRDRFPTQSILPLVWHGGIWYDLPLTFWLAHLAHRHPEWTLWQWCIALAVGFAGSWFMHFKVYAPATLQNQDPSMIVTQEAHVQRGEVTSVGWVHLMFFAIMFAVVINEVVFSKNPSMSELYWTAAFLVGLLVVGNHLVLGALKELELSSLVEYQGDPLRSAIGWSTVGGGSVIAAGVCIARGAYHLW